MLDFKTIAKDSIFSYCVACFVALILEIPLYVLTNYLKLPSNIHMICAIVLWAICIIIITWKAKKTLGFAPWSVSTQPTTQNLTYSVMVCVIFIMFSNLLFGGSRIILYLKGASLFETFVYALYQICEVGLIVMLLVFSQKLFEKHTNDASKPYGIFFTCIAWAFLYLITNGIIGSMYFACMGLSMGVVYMLVRKNPKYTLILTILMMLF